jgi:diamine N-acetyltransferase
MNQLTLRTVTDDDFKAVIGLSDTLSDAQKKCVASNVKSLAQAYLHRETAWPRAVYLDETPIGFVMLDLEPEDVPVNDKPAYYLWRFMIAGPYQNRGFGKRVFDMIVAKCRDEGRKTLYLSCDTEGPMPYRFYLGIGCVDTGRRDDDEQILKFDIVRPD